MKAIIKQLVDGVWDDCKYNIDKGWTLISNANETLDSAVIKISHLEAKLDLQPFDNVKIEDDSENIIAYFCIDSYEETQASLDGPYYNYTINLFSETKKLENIILPNLSITPHRLSTPLTIKEVVIRYWDLYCPKNRDNSFKYSLPDVYPNGFNESCPEMQWTTPTLRDVLNDLFMLKDCIVTLQNNVISWIDLTSDGNPITNYNYITRTRSSQDYASEIKMNLQNVLQESQSGYHDSVTTHEHLTFISDGAVVNDENLILKTQHPILRIKHLWVTWCSGDPMLASQSAKSPIYIKADLCNLQLRDNTQAYSLVKEKKEFDILGVKKYAEVNQLTDILPYTHYKNYCIYYSKGTNVISGFGNVNKINFLGFTSSILGTIMEFAEVDAWVKMGFAGDFVVNDVLHYDAILSAYQLARGASHTANMWFFPSFEIEYETTKEVVFSASKNELLRNERTIMDNQTNAWVNADKQGNLEYQKANRIGNEVVMINQRSAYLANAIKLFDKLNDEIVYRTEYQIFDNYIDVNAYATKNYILKDYFTGINSKIRTWVNAQDEAFIRHDLYKYYVEFDTKAYQDTVDLEGSSYLNSNLISTFISAFDETATPVRHCLIRCDNFPSETTYYEIELIRRIISQSIVLTWGFNDNYVALSDINWGAHAGTDTTERDGFINVSDFDDSSNYSAIDSFYWTKPPTLKSSSINGVGGVPISKGRYCNSDGNFTEFTVGFYGENVSARVPVYTGMALTTIDYYARVSSQIRSGNQDRRLRMTKTVYKDNKEIITGSLQIEYLSNDKRIYVYDDFLKLCELVMDSNIPDSLTFYTSSTPNFVDATLADAQINPNISNTSATIVVNVSSQDEKRYLFICRGTRPIIRLDTIRTFYINLLRKRDKEGL